MKLFSLGPVLACLVHSFLSSLHRNTVDMLSEPLLSCPRIRLPTMQHFHIFVSAGWQPEIKSGSDGKQL